MDAWILRPCHGAFQPLDVSRSLILSLKRWLISGQPRQLFSWQQREKRLWLTMDQCRTCNDHVLQSLQLSAVGWIIASDYHYMLTFIFGFVDVRLCFCPLSCDICSITFAVFYFSYDTNQNILLHEPTWQWSTITWSLIFLQLSVVPKMRVTLTNSWLSFFCFFFLRYHMSDQGRATYSREVKALPSSCHTGLAQTTQ